MIHKTAVQHYLYASAAGLSYSIVSVAASVLLVTAQLLVDAE